MSRPAAIRNSPKCATNSLVNLMSAGTRPKQLQAEVQGFSGTVTMNLKKLERELLERISSTSRRLQNEQSKLRDVEHNLQVKLRAEKEVRENETEAWRGR